MHMYEKGIYALVILRSLRQPHPGDQDVLLEIKGLLLEWRFLQLLIPRINSDFQFLSVPTTKACVRISTKEKCSFHAL